VRLIARLDEMARERGTTRNALAVSVLAEFAGVVLEEGNGRSNRDGREAEALTIIREWPEDTIQQLCDRLASAGIKRGRNWVWLKRRGVSPCRTK